jgi:Flp pilus assembly protein CpaB
MNSYFGVRGAAAAASDRKALLLFGSAALFCCGALVLFLFASRPGQTPPSPITLEPPLQGETTTVLLPLREIIPGTWLTPALFRTKAVPASIMDKGVVTSFEEIKNRYAKALLIEGAPIYTGHLTDKMPVNALTAVIPATHRGVAIRVNEQSSTHVDVLWYTKLNPMPCSLIKIVENALVISVDRDPSAQMRPDSPIPQTITLAVLPDDAGKINLAQAEGAISLVLRSQDDNGKSSGSKVITCDSLIGRAPSQPVEPGCQGTITIGGEKYCFGPDGLQAKKRRA